MPDTASYPETDDAANDRPGPSRYRWVGRTVAALLAVLVVAAVISVWFSPVLGVRSVQLATADGGPIDPQLAAQVIIAANVEDGTPLARVDLDAVAEAVGVVDAVSGVTVQRQWPHTILITVAVREAVAATQANGSWWLVDAEGRPFGNTVEQPSGLIALVLATPGPDDPATRAAATVVQDLDDDIASLVAAVTARTAHDVTLELRDGRTVLWGSVDSAKAKNAVLPGLLKQPGTTFDVSVPTLPTVSGE